VTPDRIGLEVFAKSSDRRILRRSHDGSNWGSWANIAALDGEQVDARSDLDCGAFGTTVHLVASGVSPIGAVLHAFGSDTTYNPFVRELGNLTLAPSPSIGVSPDAYFLGGLGIGATYPVFYEIGSTASPRELTPITTEAVYIRSSPDIALVGIGGSAFRYFVAFDTAGNLAVYFHVINSGGAHWEEPVNLPPPIGTFTFGPAICTENGAFGVTSIHLVAAAGGQLWHCQSDSPTAAFTPWTPIGSDVTSSPDCAVIGAQSIVHVVTTSAAGAVLDINGKGTDWVASDLGSPR
jgi:hypothetical protein